MWGLDSADLRLKEHQEAAHLVLVVVAMNLAGRDVDERPSLERVPDEIDHVPAATCRRQNQDVELDSMRPERGVIQLPELELFQRNDLHAERRSFTASEQHLRNGRGIGRGLSVIDHERGVYDLVEPGVAA